MSETPHKLSDEELKSLEEQYQFDSSGTAHVLIRACSQLADAMREIEELKQARDNMKEYYSGVLAGANYLRKENERLREIRESTKTSGGSDA